MSPKNHLKSLKARFKRILSDREGYKNREFNDSASGCSSDKKKLSSSGFKMKRSLSSSSSVNSKRKKIPSVVRTDVSSSRSSSESISGSPSDLKRKKKKESSSSSEFLSDSKIRSKPIKKLHLIGLESRLKLPLHETSQVSPSSKVFVSDAKLISEKDIDQRGSHIGLRSTMMSPTTSTDTCSPGQPRHSFSLNDSSAPSSPRRYERNKVSEELSASWTSYDPMNVLLGKSKANAKVQSKISSPKVKRIQSAFLDEERGVWRCRNCDWIYPNPNPSARHRREHKKHCGEMLNVQQWLKVIDPGGQGPVEEVNEEGPGVRPFVTEVGKSALCFNQDQEVVNNALFYSNTAAECEDLMDREAVDEREKVVDVDGGTSEPLDLETVTEVNTSHSRDEISDNNPSGINVPYLDAESGEADSHKLEIPNSALVNGFAGNDAEREETQSDVAEGNSKHRDVYDFGVTEVEEQRNVAGAEELEELPKAEAGDDAKDQQLVAGLEGGEAPKIGESQDDTEVDEVHDASGTVDARQLDLENLHSKTSDMRTKEEADFGTAAFAAHQDYGDSAETGVESEPVERGNESITLDYGDASSCLAVSANYGGGSLTDSIQLKVDSEIDNLDQAHCESHIVIGTDDYAGDKLSYVVDSSVEEVSAPRSVLTSKRSASFSSSSSSSSNSSAGNDGDKDRRTPRKTYQEVETPVSDSQENYFIDRKETTAAEDLNLCLPYKETTASPWRSRNAMQDELLESITDDAVPPTNWTRYHDIVPATVEATQIASTPTTTTTSTWQSPQKITETRTSTFNEVGIVGSAIKKEDFKHRQTFWAEITRSDILEGSQKSPFSRPSEDLITLALVDDAQSPSTFVSTAYNSWLDSSDKVEVVTRSEGVHTEASTENFHPEASTSKFHSEASTSKFHTDFHPAADEDELERVIHQQKTHDILCPVCGSCITTRVILRKRKRYPPLQDPKRPRLPAPPLPEPVRPSAEPDEGWGCLACFSIFFPRARRGEEARDPQVGSSFLQIVFPTFPWGPKEIVNDPGLTPQHPLDNNTSESGISERELPFPSTPVNSIQREGAGIMSYLEFSDRQSESEGPWLGRAPDKDEGFKGENPPTDGQGKKMPHKSGAEDEDEAPSIELPAPSPPALDLKPASPVETPEVKQSGPPVQNVPSPPLVSPPENDQCECFDIFLPFFSRGSPKLDVGNDMPPVITLPPTEVPPTDRQCVPLFWFSRKPPEQSEEPGGVTQYMDIQTPEERPSILGTEHAPVQPPATPESLPSREFLSFITRRLYRKSSEPQTPESVPLEVQRERWRDWAPHVKRTTYQYYVKLFDDIEIPSRESSWRPVMPVPPPFPLKLDPRVTTPPQPEPAEHTDSSQANADAGLDLTPVLPTVQGEDTDGPAMNCLDLVLPTFPWGPQVQGPEEEPSTNCLDFVLPTFLWGPQGQELSTSVEEHPRERPIPPPTPTEDPTDFKEPEYRKEHPPIGEKGASSQEVGRIEESEVFVGHVRKKKTTLSEDSIEVDTTVTHFEIRLDKDHQPIYSDVLKERPRSTRTRSREEDDVDNVNPGDLAKQLAETANSLHSLPRPSDETDLVTQRRDSQTSKSGQVEAVLHLPQVQIRRPGWLGLRPKGESDLEVPLLREEIQLEQTIGPVETVLNIPDSTTLPPAHVPGQDIEILKSLVYGGLDTTLISLGVVSSATGGDASTLTVIGIGLANVVFGFIAFLGNISALYKTDLSKFRQLVGPSYRINGLFAAFSYLLFGLLLPITYGFSFRHKTNRDWKMGATCLVALFSIILLGWGKARVTSQNPYTVISILVTTGFVAAIASYQVGDYVTWLLKDLGFDSV